MKLITSIFLSLIFLSNISFSQSPQSNQTNAQQPFVLGAIEKIQSLELNETRILNIYLPEKYSPDSSATYPVIYLLDGSANEDFVHVVGIVQFLTMMEAMPKSIVVGIANVDRRRDFTFPTTIAQDKKDYPTTGSSAKFMAFIENELQPFIQKKYKTNNSKTIIGQSLGGLLATEILLKKPKLFTNYMIVSPSLWWDNESLLKTSTIELEKQTDSINIYISVGNEGKIMEADAKQLYEILQASANKNLHANLIPLPEENHLTILHNSVYRGFQILYPKNISKK